MEILVAVMNRKPKRELTKKRRRKLLKRQHATFNSLMSAVRADKSLNRELTDRIDRDK